MKKRKTTMLVLMCIFAIFFLAGSSRTVSRAAGLTSDSIKEKEDQINKAEEEKKALQNSLSDIKKMKEELEKSKNNLEAYVVQLDGNLASVESKIQELQDLIEEKTTEIETTTAELNAALETEVTQYEAMKKRIQFMYESGDTLFMEALFSAESFGEMLNKAEYIELLSQYDRDKLNQYVLNRQLIELCKQQLEEEKGILDQAKLAQQAEQDNLEELIVAKEQQITSFESDIDNKEAAIKQYEDEIAAQTQVIKELERIVAEEKKKLLEENGTIISYDGGVFKWPAPSYTKISSDYGNRMHPTLGVSLFHNGVDMAAPSGTQILAAYDGKVVAADYSSTMGNYIMIDHGDGLYTVYMHASALYVSKGAVVIKGEHIAAVGSTGRSTGPHLHFSVRLNGEYVSPWNYLSQ